MFLCTSRLRALIVALVSLPVVLTFGGSAQGLRGENQVVAQSATIDSLTPNSGSVSGGTVVTLVASGVDFTAATPSVTVSAQAATNITVSNATTLTFQTPANVTVGATTVEYEVGGVTASLANAFVYRPLLVRVDNGSRVLLGALASRTQGKQITVSASTPLMMSGIDSRSGNPYSEETSFYYSDVSHPAWGYEGWEVGVTTGSSSITTTITIDPTHDGRSDVFTLNSSGGCTHDNSTGSGIGPSYCSAFGPDIWSEAFYATDDQALGFTWQARNGGDHYEIYAFLVRVDDTTKAIPTTNLTTSNPSDAGHHTLVVHQRGSVTGWNTSTQGVPLDGHYRFRFVNGTYDKTGLKGIGANLYLDPQVIIGTPQTIIFTTPNNLARNASQSLAASASSGLPVSFSSTDTSICTVSGTTVTAKNVTGTCTIVASQGGGGQWAPAPSVTQSFTITAATIPGAVQNLAVSQVGRNSSLSVQFDAPASDGGSAITRYEYSLDGSTWTTATTTGGSGTPFSFAISGLRFQNYTVYVRAVNGVGDGPSSSGTRGLIPPPPDPVASTAPPSTAPVSTTAPAPSSTVPSSSTTNVPVNGSAPETVPTGELPEVPPGQSLAFENGVAVPVVVEQVQAPTVAQETVVWRMEGSGFQMDLEVPATSDSAGASASQGGGVVTLVRSRETRVSGTGFSPGTWVDVWLMSTPRFIGSVLVGPDGTFLGELPIPSNVEVGLHTLQANGVTQDGTSRSLNLGVQVLEDRPMTLPITGSDPGPTTLALFAIVLGGLVLAARRRSSLTTR